MFLKDVDFLSQKISLFFYGRKRHSSIFGGILTILMILGCFSYLLYLFYEVYSHKSSTIQYYRHYFKNPGNYSFNNTEGIFHFFQISNTKDNEILPIDSKFVRIFMTNNYEEYKTNPDNSKLLTENDHWVYDDCRDGIDNKYLSKEIFNEIPLKNGLCIRYYYNSNDKQYYSIDDVENFKYPYFVNLGKANGDTVGTIIEKCNNNSILTSLFGPCTDKVSIDNYFSDISNFRVDLNVLSHEIRPGVYEETMYNFINVISNEMKKKTIIENNIIFTPVLTYFKFGVFLPKKSKNQIYTFSESYADTVDKKEKNNLLGIYKFYLSKKGYIYKASYQTIYDCMYKIGGIFQLIYYIFFVFNYIFNKFTIINDTKRLFFSLNNNDKAKLGTQIKQFSKIVKNIRHDKRNNDSSINIIKYNNASNLDKIENNLENKYKHSLSNNFQESSFFRNNMNNKELIIFPFSSKKDKKNNNNNSYDNNEKKLIINDSDILEASKDEINQNEKHNENNKSLFKKYSKKEKKENTKILSISKNIIDRSNYASSNNLIDKEVLDFKVLLSKYFDYKKTTFNYEKMNIEKFDYLFSIKNYMISFFCIKRPKNYFFILKNFRKKLLSEEHFFRSQKYLYLFEKYFDLKESKKIDIIELYKNL